MSSYIIQSETLTAIADAIREKRKAAETQYKQLEYIESTGTQYIDTNYYVTSENLKIEACLLFTEIKPWAAPWGVEGTQDKTLSLTPLINLNSELTFYSGTSSQVGAIPIQVDTIYSLVCQTNNGVIRYECNGNVAGTTAQGQLCKTDSFYIFTLNSADKKNILSQASKMRLYYFRIYDGDILVRDFVPCVDSEGIYGLYDKLSETFYVNIGSDLFIGGPEITTNDNINQDAQILVSSMAEEILNIEAGSSIDGTATKDDILNGKTAYVKGKKIVGTIPSKTEDDVTSENGIINIPSGFYPNNISKIEPNLIAENIKNGIDIFGILGSLKTLPLKIKNIGYTSYTPTTDYSGAALWLNHDFDHNLDFSIIWPDFAKANIANQLLFGAHITKDVYSITNLGGLAVYVYDTGNGYTSWVGSWEAQPPTISIPVISSSTTGAVLKAGVTYHIIYGALN